MPCPTCGSILVRFGKFIICPQCNKVPILNKKNAIFELYKNELAVEERINEIIRKAFNKNKLIIELCWERERFARKFFEEYQALEANAFLSSNLLILRIITDDSFSGRKTVEPYEIKALIDGFKAIIESKEIRFLLMQGFAEPMPLGNKIHSLYNEKYFPILYTYAIYDILEEAEAKEKIKEYLPLLNLAKAKAKKTQYSPELFIHKFYPTIHQFYCCFFTRNELYTEVFGLLKHFAKEKLTPYNLMALVNSYLMNHNSLYHTSSSEFIKRAKKYFRMDAKKIRNSLIFSERNTKIFPFFVEINGRVYISHRATFLVFILLHAIVYKKIFDKETETKSRDFEKEEVKKIFQNMGWQYLTNITDKKKATLEIDGIAIYGRKMIVIECKGWKLKPFSEYKNQQDQITRDLKGIVDGLKYSKRKPKPIPPLLEKIQFAKQNMSKWDLDPKKIDSVEGLIILRNYPPITEYKGIQISCIKDLEKKYNFRTYR
ncbi:MAG: NERD domain-containing protein [Candidatus Bathyarchaeota archaeon]|nr:NERD domain-containing protein [Candidatus Bathyarchaeota archaeon]